MDVALPRAGARAPHYDTRRAHEHRPFPAAYTSLELSFGDPNRWRSPAWSNGCPNACEPGSMSRARIVAYLLEERLARNQNRNKRWLCVIDNVLSNISKQFAQADEVVSDGNALSIEDLVQFFQVEIQIT